MRYNKNLQFRRDKNLWTAATLPDSTIRAFKHYSGPRKTGPPSKLLVWARKGELRMGKRKQHTASFKGSGGALAAVKGRPDHQRAGGAARRPSDADSRLEEAVARRGRGGVFASGAKAKSGPADDHQSGSLYEQIGRPSRWSWSGSKKLPPSAEGKRPLIEADHPALSVRRQCELLGLNRSSLYYEAAAETEENLRLMRRIDGQYTACPFYGSRRIRAWAA